jgi:hypothetical protein
MLNDNIISGQSELAHANIAAADDLMIHDADAAEVKKVGVDSIQNFFFGNVSGDATIADGGALTIAANAVQGTMLNTDVVNSTSFAVVSNEIQLKSDVAGDGLALASHILSVNVSGAVKIASDKVGITGSIAGNGLQFAGGADSISALSVQLDASNGGAAQMQTTSTGLSIKSSFAGNGLAMESNVLALSIAGLADELGSATLADTDEFAISDAGSMKKIDFQHVRDSVFADVSGDATVAAGGALTIANDAVEQAMIADDAVGADQLAQMLLLMLLLLQVPQSLLTSLTSMLILVETYHFW